MRYSGYLEMSTRRTYRHYDHMFKVAAYAFFGGSNLWALRLKAQGIQESSLTMTENAISHAYGVMQVMPATFNWLTLGKMDIKDAYANIMAGAAYMAWLFGKDIAMKDVKGQIVGPQIFGFHKLNIVTDEAEKWKFCLAGYNCGIGHITGKKTGKCCWDYLREQGRDLTLWDNSAGVLRLITGDRNSEETIKYVESITTMAKWMEDAHENLVVD